ncbi:hypothetical protein QZH41_010617, partial [Actinostola sp. cb2023]
WRIWGIRLPHPYNELCGGCCHYILGFERGTKLERLRWGDVQLQQDPVNGHHMLVWVAERGTKTRTGKEHGHQRAFQPKAFATNTNRCPVRFYQIFESHHPVEMNAPDSPFFLAVRNHRADNDPVWYMKAPLGKNEIGKFLSSAAEKAGIQRAGKKLQPKKCSVVPILAP